MKVSLVVKDGVHAGKTIPIGLSQFLIGRDPQCNLRPASAAISKRHCALLIRQDKVFIRDLNSTNGTFVNERQVKGEIELLNEDILRIGPLSFAVQVEVAETAVAAAKTAPAEAPKRPGEATADDDVAAMLLGMKEEDVSSTGAVNEESIPTGSTVMEIMPTNPADAEAAKKDAKKEAPKPAATTTAAAEAILQKYLRRPRG